MSKTGDRVKIKVAVGGAMFREELPEDRIITLGGLDEDGCFDWNGWCIMEEDIECFASEQRLEPAEPPYEPGNRVVITTDPKKVKDSLLDKLPKDRIITLGERCLMDCEHNVGLHWEWGDYAISEDLIEGLAPEQPREWWTADDYAKRQIVYFKDKIPTKRIYRAFEIRNDGIVIDSIFRKYEEIAEDFTLPDGAELYKENK